MPASCQGGHQDTSQQNRYEAESTGQQSQSIGTNNISAFVTPRASAVFFSVFHEVSAATELPTGMRESTVLVMANPRSLSICCSLTIIRTSAPMVLTEWQRSARRGEDVVFRSSNLAENKGQRAITGDRYGQARHNPVCNRLYCGNRNFHCTPDRHPAEWPQ